MRLLPAPLLISAFLALGGCCQALRYVERRVACSALVVADFQAAILSLPGWEISLPPPEDPHRRWTWADADRGERLLDLRCRRGQREIHLQLAGPSKTLYLYTENGAGLRASLESLYRTLEAHCDGLPAWETMDEQRAGDGTPPSADGLIYAVFVFGLMGCLVLGGVGLVLNRGARAGRRPARHQ